MANDSKLYKIKAAIELAGAAISVVALILASFEYFLNISIFYDPTKDYAQEYKITVLPIYKTGEQFSVKNAQTINNEKSKFESMIKEYVSSHNLEGDIVAAGATLDKICSCHRNIFCRIDDYNSYRQVIRSVWFNFQPVFKDLRIHSVVPTFASSLEVEANRILDEDRKNNLTPK